MADISTDQNAQKPTYFPPTISGLMAALVAGAGWMGTEFMDMDRRLTRMEVQWDAKTEEISNAVQSIEKLIVQVDRRLYLIEASKHGMSGMPPMPSPSGDDPYDPRRREF